MSFDSTFSGVESSTGGTSFVAAASLWMGVGFVSKSLDNKSNAVLSSMVFYRGRTTVNITMSMH